MREAQKKIVRGLVKAWVKHKPMVIAAVLAVTADIGGVCVAVNTNAAATVAKETVEEAPPPVANVEGYSDIFDSDASAGPTKAPKKTVVTTKEDGTTVEEEAPTVLELNSKTKPGYMNNCYFLGDSRLVAMVSYGFVSDSNVLAKIGVSHTAVESTTFMQNSGKQYTVKQYLAEKKPPVVYVCYGVNGMNGISEEKYEKTYKELVEHIMEWAPDSKIVLMSIWPVDDNGRYKGNVKNEWINKYNDFLLALAEYEGLYYLDVASVLKDSNGSIKPEFDGGDGLHYRASAYNTILDYIMHHPVKGISDEGEFKVHYVKPSGEFKKIMTEKPKLPDNVVPEEPMPSPSPEVTMMPTPTIIPTIIPTPTVGTTPTVIPTPENPGGQLTPSPDPEGGEDPLPSLSPSPTQAPEDDGEPTPTPDEGGEEPTPTPEGGEAGPTPPPEGEGGEPGPEPAPGVE